MSSYDAFIAEASRHCRCHPCCWSHPCDGVLAGGMCDRMRCSCDDEPRDPIEDEQSD